jgi:flagellin-like hook-associated protein FlgL
VEQVIPLPEMTQHLEALKLRLVRMGADALSPEQTAAMAQEISAIRLQLKRLRAEQDAMGRAVHAADADEPLTRPT